VSDTRNRPVATLAGVTLPGDHRPVNRQALRENISVLRPLADGASWQRIDPSPGMPIHAGDVINLKGDAFRALGARAFTVSDGTVGVRGMEPPGHLQLQAHETTHVVQQGGARVMPLNDGEADFIEKHARAVEQMVLQDIQPPDLETVMQAMRALTGKDH
jgi:hypothetical protein